MRKTSYIIFGLWVIVAVLSKILLDTSWWIALSWLWLPLAVAFVVVFGLSLSVDIGKLLRRRQAEAEPDRCANCLFGQTAEYDKHGKCLGENLDETIHRPTLCKFYKRHEG